MTKQKIPDEVKVLAQTEFVEGFLDSDNVRHFPSYRVLSQRHGVHENTVANWGRKQGWQDKRTAFQTKLQEELTKSKVSSFVGASQKFDERCLTAANMIIAVIGRGLRDAQKNPLPTNELRDMATTLVNAQKAGKLALGEAQEIQKVTADAGIPESFVELCEILERTGQRKAEEGNHIIN